MIEEVRGRVIGDKNIDQTVFVKIAADHSQAVVAVWIRNSSFLRNVAEGAVAVVVIERIAGAGQTSRTTLHRHSFELAGHSYAELGQMIKVKTYVVRNEEVE